MPFLAILLLFLAAFLHTAWNLLLKGAKEKQITTWWSVLIGSSLFLPALLFTGLPDRSTWGLLVLSTTIEIGYYILLSMAYKDGDFSLVYPIARGAAPGLIAVWSVLFLHETLTQGGVAGLLIITMGLLVVGGANAIARSRASVASTPPRGMVLALLLALLISIYSIIDGAAVKRTSPLPYATLIFFLAPAIMTPLVIGHYGWPTLQQEFKLDRWRMIGIGILVVTAYLLALIAYSFSPISYAGSIREVSVVIGAFTGWKLLGEKLGPMRVIGAAIIFAGILVIAVYG